MVQQFIQAFDTSQRNKHDTSAPAGLLQPLPISNQVWEDITMDFIEGLPRSKGYNAILVVVDCLTKYAHFVALKHPFTTITVAQYFIQEIVRLHGIPRSIIYDWDPIFMSLFGANCSLSKDRNLGTGQHIIPKLTGNRKWSIGD